MSRARTADEVALIVIAKQPLPGRCKTRLCPPLTPAEAAAVAEAALVDTVRAVARTPASRRVIALEGEPGAWLEPGFEIVPQPAGGLDARLAGAFERVRGPALLIGMDTPQLTWRALAAAATTLTSEGVDAVLGPAVDGGYWAIGLHEPQPGAFEGVPMSSRWTASVQRARLRQLGLRVAEVGTLRDVDTIEDARAVAESSPRTEFARALSMLPWAAAA